MEVILRTKRNLYHFLTVEVDFVLPPIDFTSMEWLSGVWRGELRVSHLIFLTCLTFPLCQPLRSSEAKPCFANHIKGIRVRDLIEFARKHGLKLYLPVPTRTGQPPKYHRAWLLTVSICKYALPSDLQMDPKSSLLQQIGSLLKARAAKCDFALTGKFMQMTPPCVRGDG